MRENRDRYNCSGCDKPMDRCTCDDLTLKDAGPDWAWSDYWDDTDIFCANCRRGFGEHHKFKCLFEPTRWTPSVMRWEEDVRSDGTTQYVESYVTIPLTYEPMRATIQDLMRFEWQKKKKSR